MERTGVSDVEQHGNKDVVHQVQSDAVSKQGVPHHQQVLERKLPTEQQAYPPAAAQTKTYADFMCGKIKVSDKVKGWILTCRRFVERSRVC